MQPKTVAHVWSPAHRFHPSSQKREMQGLLYTIGQGKCGNFHTAGKRPRRNTNWSRAERCDPKTYYPWWRQSRSEPHSSFVYEPYTQSFCRDRSVATKAVHHQVLDWLGCV